MTIQAKRFKFLDEETNVPVASLIDAKTSDIFNSPNSVVKNVSTEMQGFIDTGKQIAGTVTGTVKDLQDKANNLIREIKGIVGSLKDILDLPMGELDALIANMFPDDKASQTAFSKAIEKCKSDALKIDKIGKPYDKTINCNGNSRVASGNNCDSAQFSNLLNKISGGAYNSKVNDLNGVLSKLMSMSKFGYDMNMCGVFGALATNVTNRNVLSRASGGLIGLLGADSNTAGILDLVSNSVGLDTKLENPDSLATIFSTFTIPKDIKEVDYSEFAERTLAAAEIIDDEWNIDGTSISIAKFSTNNSSLNNVFRSKTMDKVVSDTHLNVAPDSDFDFINVANSLNSSREFNIGSSFNLA